MKRFLTLALAACLCAAGLLAQQPQFKSQEEFDAFVAVQNATTVQDRATAGVAFLGTFPESEAAGLAAYMTMLSYQQLNDFDNMLLYGDMVLEHDPAPGVTAGTLISLAGAIPTRTREFDLDKEEKLAKAEDYAKRAMGLIPTLVKMDPNMSDDEWLAARKEFMSQCHEALGSVALKREDFAASEASFRQALELSAEPLPFTLYNLATALSKQGKNEEAAAEAQRCSEIGGFRDGAGNDLCAELRQGL
ncbi:MAG: hypothetical protein OXJ37_10600 [Bryobacterales bacterium]|nr:hypothetical protein [Bryobacterales bacterium]MDE0262838.1 hypothetical protein [Bryobacterales bacterium]MDE0622591.1 hypothetical protein [Bryobacterales bacterium]